MASLNVENWMLRLKQSGEVLLKEVGQRFAHDRYEEGFEDASSICVEVLAKRIDALSKDGRPRPSLSQKDLQIRKLLVEIEAEMDAQLKGARSELAQRMTSRQ